MCPSSRSGIGKTKGVVTCLNGCVLGWCVTLSFLVEGGGCAWLFGWHSYVYSVQLTFGNMCSTGLCVCVCVCLGITWIFTPTYPRINTQSFDILVILNTHTNAFGAFLCQKQDVAGGGWWGWCGGNYLEHTPHNEYRCDFCLKGVANRFTINWANQMAKFLK